MPQVSQRLNLPGIIKAMLRWTGRLGFTRAAQNVMYRIWAKHVIYMSAFVFDCTHLVCHDQNLGTFIRSGAQGDEGVWPLSQALESLNQNQFSQGIAVLRQPAPLFGKSFRCTMHGRPSQQNIILWGSKFIGLCVACPCNLKSCCHGSVFSTFASTQVRSATWRIWLLTSGFPDILPTARSYLSSLRAP